MIATAKKGQRVQQGIRVRISQPSSPTFTLPRQRPSSSGDQLSEYFFRLLYRSIFCCCVLAFLASLLLRWYIKQENQVLEEILIVNTRLVQEHNEQQEIRDHLASPSRIAAAAAVRLNLYLPEKEQEHHLY